MKTLIKQIPIFGGRITILIDDDLEKVRQKYHLQDTENVDALAFRTSTKHSKRMYVVAFEKNEITPSTMSHEAIHIANFVLEDIGHNIDTYNDEVQCYLTGWIVDQITSMLLKNKIKIKLLK